MHERIRRHLHRLPDWAVSLRRERISMLLQSDGRCAKLSIASATALFPAIACAAAVAIFTTSISVTRASAERSAHLAAHRAAAPLGDNHQRRLVRGQRLLHCGLTSRVRSWGGGPVRRAVDRLGRL